MNRRLYYGLATILFLTFLCSCQGSLPNSSKGVVAESVVASVPATASPEVTTLSERLILPILPAAQATEPEATTLVVETPSSQATREPTPTDRPTPTVQPTLTPVATPTLAPTNTLRAQVKIDRPVSGMFLPSPVEVAGTVKNAQSGSVRIVVQTPDGKAIGIAPVLATTEPVGDGLRFTATLPLGMAPTPRSLLIAAEYLDTNGTVIGFAQQPVNAIGRFSHTQYLMVESPLPYTRTGDETMIVQGAAPGPPKSVLVRLLDDQGNALVSMPAELGWYQPGLPCDFVATVPNNPAAKSVEVVSLGENDKVLERITVPLGAPIH